MPSDSAMRAAKAISENDFELFREPWDAAYVKQVAEIIDREMGSIPDDSQWTDVTPAQYRHLLAAKGRQIMKLRDEIDQLLSQSREIGAMPYELQSPDVIPSHLLAEKGRKIVEELRRHDEKNRRKLEGYAGSD